MAAACGVMGDWVSLPGPRGGRIYLGRGPIGAGTRGYTRGGDQSEQGQEDIPGRGPIGAGTRGYTRELGGCKDVKVLNEGFSANGSMRSVTRMFVHAVRINHRPIQGVVDRCRTSLAEWGRGVRGPDLHTSRMRNLNTTWTRFRPTPPP
eukprot:1196340-Prorocentrum_minimum.AAC.2